jgi:hypothetical protein
MVAATPTQIAMAMQIANSESHILHPPSPMTTHFDEKRLTSALSQSCGVVNPLSPSSKGGYCSHGLSLAFLKPATDENDWSNYTHKSCTANDSQRRIRQGT